MGSPPIDFIAAIAEHSAGFASEADGNLDADVEHCPGWTVADLVQHLTTTHWFWATIVEERLSATPDEARRPLAAERELLIATFRAGADRLVEILRAADGRDKVYTWAPGQQDIDFITRHQAQEAAVHHWDAVHAAGGALRVEAPLATDAIAEFLTFSVSSDTDPAEPVLPALSGQFALRSDDAETEWTVSDGQIPGTVAFKEGARTDAPGITATSSDLLLWLYERVEVDATAVPSDLIRRFRALCFTD
jgi:uncharacterized protein (TIGR03083 family)